MFIACVLIGVVALVIKFVNSRKRKGGPHTYVVSLKDARQSDSQMTKAQTPGDYHSKLHDEEMENRKHQKGLFSQDTGLGTSHTGQNTGNMSKHNYGAINLEEDNQVEMGQYRLQ